jgi:hypothetical protein
MLNETVEKQFREYMEALRHSSRSVMSGGDQRDDFQRIWLTVINDDSVQQVLHRMLFVPCHIPDWLQGNHIIRILEHLHGRQSQLLFFDDIVVAEAEIVAVRIGRESGGPVYFVTYMFVDLADKTWQFEREYGYDEMHAGFNGWGVKELSEYWKTGNKIPCHYRASQPSSHYLCQP